MKPDGSLISWGSNAAGELGNNNPSNDTLSPAPVSGLTSMIAVAATSETGYALRSDGTVWSFGGNVDDELGDGTNNTHSPVPVRVKGLSGAAGIGSGADTGYAIGSDGFVSAWGGGFDRPAWQQHRDGQQRLRSGQWAHQRHSRRLGLAVFRRRSPSLDRERLVLGGFAIAAG